MRIVNIIMSRGFVVLGMHRGGTSLTAGFLSSLGVNFGHNLMPPTSINEKGHFEDKEGMWLNEIILTDRRCTWYDLRGWDWEKRPKDTPPNSVQSNYRYTEMFVTSVIQRLEYGYEFWGIKDPRLCVTLPFWYEVLKNKDVTYIKVERDKESNVASMLRAEWFREWPREAAENRCNELYDTYHKLIDTFLEEKKVNVIKVDPDNLIRDPESFIKAINIDPPVPNILEALRFIDPSLYHKKEDK